MKQFKFRLEKVLRTRESHVNFLTHCLAQKVSEIRALKDALLPLEADVRHVQSSLSAELKAHHLTAFEYQQFQNRAHLLEQKLRARCETIEKMEQESKKLSSQLVQANQETSKIEKLRARRLLLYRTQNRKKEHLLTDFLSQQNKGKRG